MAEIVATAEILVKANTTRVMPQIQKVQQSLNGFKIGGGWNHDLLQMGERLNAVTVSAGRLARAFHSFAVLAGGVGHVAGFLAIRKYMEEGSAEAIIFKRHLTSLQDAVSTVGGRLTKLPITAGAGLTGILKVLEASSHIPGLGAFRGVGNLVKSGETHTATEWIDKLTTALSRLPASKLQELANFVTSTVPMITAIVLLKDVLRATGEAFHLLFKTIKAYGAVDKWWSGKGGKDDGTAAREEAISAGARRVQQAQQRAAATEASGATIHADEVIASTAKIVSARRLAMAEEAEAASAQAAAISGALVRRNSGGAMVASSSGALVRRGPGGAMVASSRIDEARFRNATSVSGTVGSPYGPIGAAGAAGAVGAAAAGAGAAGAVGAAAGVAAGVENGIVEGAEKAVSGGRFKSILKAGFTGGLGGAVVGSIGAAIVGPHIAAQTDSMLAGGIAAGAIELAGALRGPLGALAAVVISEAGVAYGKNLDKLLRWGSGESKQDAVNAAAVAAIPNYHTSESRAAQKEAQTAIEEYNRELERQLKFSEAIRASTERSTALAMRRADNEDTVESQRESFYEISDEIIKQQALLNPEQRILDNMTSGMDEKDKNKEMSTATYIEQQKRVDALTQGIIRLKEERKGTVQFLVQEDRIDKENKARATERIDQYHDKLNTAQDEIDSRRETYDDDMINKKRELRHAQEQPVQSGKVGIGDVNDAITRSIAESMNKQREVRRINESDSPQNMALKKAAEALDKAEKHLQEIKDKGIEKGIKESAHDDFTQMMNFLCAAAT